MKTLRALLALVVASVFLIGNAVADPGVSFSTNNLSLTGLGDEVNQGFDKLTLTGLSSTFIGNSGTATIGTYSFVAGFTGEHSTGTFGSTAGFGMTIGSQTKDILFPYSLSIGAYTDTLTITGNAPPVMFTVGGNYLTVTGLAFGPLSSGGTADSGNLIASYVTNPVPEPETYAMMLAGLGLMGFIARRRKQSSAAA